LPRTSFWNNAWPSDTDGELKGTVLFAQAQILPSKHRVDGDNMQPHLTANRKTLVMFKPSDENMVDQSLPLQMSVKDDAGTVRSVNMEHPDDIPKQAGWIPNAEWLQFITESITFPSSLDDPYVITGKSNLNKANDPTAVYLSNILNNENTKVHAKYNGGSSSNLYLPDGNSVPNDSIVLVTSNAGDGVTVNYPNAETGGWRTQKLSRGTQVTLVLSNGIWVANADLEHNQYVFGNGFWTAIMDAEWVQPGITIDFQQGLKMGSLDGVDVGGMTELVITALDAGFLTEPRDEFYFKDDDTAHREYFETIPVTRLVVAQYESLHLTEVMLPSGVLYNESSSGKGGWQTGDMRQATGKILLSHGIDLANYGISSSSGSKASAHPFTCGLLAAQNTVGIYTNGRKVHGGSGGNGIITVTHSLGTEMSHEAGHNYGLGHFEGGFTGSVHRPADQPGSTWGWDSDKNVFIPNFWSIDSGQDICCCPQNKNDQCERPFMGKFKFGKDPMAAVGGDNVGSGGMWSPNRFTLYTPNSMSKIQNFLENKAVWDPDSRTGFKKYNPSTRTMDEFENPNNGKVPRLYRVPVTTLVGYYDMEGIGDDESGEKAKKDYIYPALHGAYGFVYEDDQASDNGCDLRVQTINAGTRVFQLSAQRVTMNVMNKFHVNIAADDMASVAEIYCGGQLRARRELQGRRGELKYTVNGIPF
jgi:hypothetical protein